MMFSLEKPELGAGTMYAPAGTTFTKQTSATLKMSNIANIRKNRVGEDAQAKDTKMFNRSPFKAWLNSSALIISNHESIFLSFRNPSFQPS